MNAKYRVVLWEYERGWGSKPFTHSDFDSKEEALVYVKEVNSKNTAPTAPDYYIQAEDPILVDLDAVGTKENY
jgi:hypothetical protein